MDIASVFNKFGTAFMNSLPRSPFAQFIDKISIPHLDYLNWFFPISEFIVISGVWLTSITLIYLYSVILKWLKILGD